MQIESKACLEDIRCASELIFEFVDGKDFNCYTEDIMLKSAIERQFEIVSRGTEQTLQKRT